MKISFNPSRGIAIIQTPLRPPGPARAAWFQSLTRDSNHSNAVLACERSIAKACFNPSRGIAIIQTRAKLRPGRLLACFNPSRGIAIIQTGVAWRGVVTTPGFNPSRGIAIIQTPPLRITHHTNSAVFQSLTRDSNHSNCCHCLSLVRAGAFQSLTRDSNHSNPFSPAVANGGAHVSIPHAG